MKCIWHWKWKADIFEDDRYRKVSKKFTKALKEDPDSLPKVSLGMHKGRGEGMTLVEGTYEQLLNLVAIWEPVENWRLEVYFESPEIYRAIRKWHPDSLM